MANLSYRVEGKKYAWLQKLGISAATIGVYLEDICRFSTVKGTRYRLPVLSSSVNVFKRNVLKS